MFKKFLLLLLAGSFALTAQAGLKIEHFGREKEITMLVVPRDTTTIKIANDIARRHAVLLVCYQQANSQLQIHAWNGEQWVTVSEEDYTNGAFFSHPPKHTILVESEDSPAPDSLIPDGTWCTTGNRLTSTDPRVMIHLLGRYFDFPYRTWKDFSRRYDLPFEKINPAFINTRLWNHYGEKTLSMRSLRDTRADMDQWLDLDITPPPPVEPVVIKKPTPPAPAKIPAAKPIEKPVKKVEKKETASKVKAIAEKPKAKDKPAPLTEAEKISNILADITAAEANAPASDGVVDPFSTEEIPVAEVILPSAE